MINSTHIQFIQLNAKLFFIFLLLIHYTIIIIDLFVQ